MYESYTEPMYDIIVNIVHDKQYFSQHGFYLLKILLVGVSYNI